MPHLLRIDSSARLAGSHSRAMGDLILDEWSRHHPQDNVTRRDLASSAPPLLDENTVAGFFTPEHDLTPEMLGATAVSDVLIHELAEADFLLITVPIYNFGVPASLKAWIDQVIRVDKTFAYEDGAFRGLLSIEKAILACSYGAEGYAPGAPFASADFMAPYLEFVLKFIGVHEVQIIRREGTSAPTSTMEDTVASLSREAMRTALTAAA